MIDCRVGTYKRVIFFFFRSFHWNYCGTGCYHWSYHSACWSHLYGMVGDTAINIINKRSSWTILTSHLMRSFVCILRFDRKKMRFTASSNQDIFTQIQQNQRQHPLSDSSSYAKQQHQLGSPHPLSLTPGLVATASLPHDNDYSYVKDMWPAMSRDGEAGRNHPSGPDYQTQHLKGFNQAGHSTLDRSRSRSPRPNVHFRDDMSLRSTNDQHIYESPDIMGRGYKTMGCSQFDSCCSSSLPRAACNAAVSDQRDLINQPHEINDNEEVWQRRSTKNTTVALWLNLLFSHSKQTLSSCRKFNCKLIFLVGTKVTEHFYRAFPSLHGQIWQKVTICSQLYLFSNINLTRMWKEIKF